MISILMMGLSSVCIGLLPTYDQIGPVAAVLLVLLRIVQEVSVGGEFTGSIVFTVEHAPAGKRGLFTSCANMGATAGFPLGSGLLAYLATFLIERTSEDMSPAWYMTGFAVLALATTLSFREPAGHEMV